MTTENNRPCNGCGAEPGEQHRDWDDIARCALSGVQAIQCSGEDDEPHPLDVEDYGSLEAWREEHFFYHPGKCELSTWDGEYPGVKAARKYGMFTYHRLYSETTGEVTEDLNSLHQIADWDVESQDYVMSDEQLQRYFKRR